jgi:hypothetical protein
MQQLHNSMRALAINLVSQSAQPALCHKHLQSQQYHRLHHKHLNNLAMVKHHLRQKFLHLQPLQRHAHLQHLHRACHAHHARATIHLLLKLVARFHAHLHLVRFVRVNAHLWQEIVQDQFVQDSQRDHNLAGQDHAQDLHHVLAAVRLVELEEQAEVRHIAHLLLHHRRVHLILAAKVAAEAHVEVQLAPLENLAAKKESHVRVRKRCVKNSTIWLHHHSVEQ